MTSSDDSIGDMVRSIAGLAHRAVSEYTPVVNSLVRDRSVDVRQIERTLDGLLDFCFDAEALRLFKQLCRHYRLIDPVATAAYIDAYREMWDSDPEQSRG
jgi:hypothetical protein